MVTTYIINWIGFIIDITFSVVTTDLLQHKIQILKALEVL